MVSPGPGQSKRKPPRHPQRRVEAKPAARLSDNARPAAEGEAGGEFEMDLPYKVEINKPFQLDIWLLPADPKFNQTVKVFMEQNSRMQYTPRVFELTPGVRKTISARILKSDSGLGEIIATADGWKDYYATVDAGFSARIRSNVKPSIESGKTQTFTIDFIDGNGKPVSLDAPVSVTLQSSNTRIREVGEMLCDDEGDSDAQTAETVIQNKNTNKRLGSLKRQQKEQVTRGWCDNISFKVERGTSTTPLIQIKPQTIFPEKGAILVEVRMNDDFLLLNDRIWFDILPRWWIPLLMTILGGLLYSLYKLIKGQDNLKTNEPGTGVKYSSYFVITVVTGMVSGVLAYLLGNYGILGFKVDTSSLQGFVILGFLFSYVGVDAILKAATQRGEAKHDSVGQQKIESTRPTKTSE